MNQVRTYRIAQLPDRTVWTLISGLTAGVAFTVPFLASLNSALIILLLIVWIFIVPKDFHEWKTFLAVGVLFLLAIVGMIHTTNIEEGLFRIQQKALLLVLPLIYFTSRIDRHRLSQIALSMFILGIAAACLYCLGDALVFWVGESDVSRFTAHGLAYAIDMYPYILALCCLLCQVILVEAYIGKLKLFSWMTRRWVCWTAISFFAILVFLLSVQQVILIWILLVGIETLRLTRVTSHRFYLIVSTMILATVAVIAIRPLREKFDELIFDNNRNQIPLDDEAPWDNRWSGISIRKAIWTCGWDVVRENKWVGVGTGDSQDALQESYSNRKFYLAALYNRYNAHNQYLQTTIAFGSMGLIVWLLAMVWLSKKYWTNKLFLLSMACLLLAMLTESMLETNKGNLVMALICSAFLLHSLSGKERV